MNHHVRLRLCAVLFTCTCTGHGAVSDQQSRLVSFLCLGRCGGSHEKAKSLPNYLAQLRSRADGRGGGGRLKQDGCATVCVVIQVSLCAHVPCALGDTSE